MLIGLLSDTHIARDGELIPQQVKEVFSGADLILHAGDIWIPSVLDELETIAPVKAAWGDDDLESDIGDDARMISERTLEFGGITLWLMHEKPAYGLIVPGKHRLTFHRDKTLWKIPDVVVYGHTHNPLIENHKGVLIINPGSPTWPHHVQGLGTVGLLTVEDGKAEAEIIRLE